MEHNRKQPEHNLQKIVLTQRVTTQLVYCIINSSLCVVLHSRLLLFMLIYSPTHMRTVNIR